MKIQAYRTVVTDEWGPLKRGSLVVCPDDLALRAMFKYPRCFVVWFGDGTPLPPEEPVRLPMEAEDA